MSEYHSDGMRIWLDEVEDREEEDPACDDGTRERKKRKRPSKKDLVCLLRCIFVVEKYFSHH